MQLPENIATINYYFIFDRETFELYHLKGTTSERSAELYGEGNERQLCVGDWTQINELFFILRNVTYTITPY